ncbi:SDR family NAD(P)-dependent oxidoreductase [Acuticoccus mangrovi]|uniref:SDR family oxidoreductase n=1 Tax=Acuticoccus mangrovi TaxID=2796142 RepID=A0A934ITT4_9HYPH|nr:SDR family oxidoreductase [Acuticoccus mangrovi]MBJ3778610.1 SDR family oxidoreductase [Acuticoccus mangrovi]
MARLAVVTGGNTGIGRHLAHGFAGAGFDVAVSYKARPELAESLVGEIEAAGGRALAIAADAGDAAEVAAFFDRVEATFGAAADVLVNNAGIQTWSSLLDLDVADWEAVIRTNLTGAFLNTKEAAARMVAAGKGGAVVNIGSGCNRHAFPRLVDYGASKGGIEQFTKSAAVDLGPHGIRVNCVAPGAILNERTMAEQPDYAGAWAKITPLRRVGTAQDVVGPVLFFASDAARFVTGQTLFVDGGVFTQANWPAG